MVRYVIGHWVGVNCYNITDAIKKSYQKIIDKYGNVVMGSPQGKTDSTGGMNSITYNISCAGGDIQAPLTVAQCESFFKECAKDLKRLKLTPNDFYTHAEIGELVRTNKITKLLPNNRWLYLNKGKIDLIRLPYDLDGKTHGDFIRGKILWYYKNIM